MPYSRRDLEKVYLSDIRDIDRDDLDTRKLEGCENASDSFDTMISEDQAMSDCIVLDKPRPYDITNGRHRIYLARKKRHTYIYAVVR